MTPEAVYRAYIDAENRRDRSGMERTLHAEVVVTVNGVPQLGDRDADAAATDRLLARYPDYRRVLRRLHVAGDTVVAEWSMTGSADPDRAIPALDVRGCSIAEVRAGRIAAAHLYADSRVLDGIIAGDP